MMRPLGRLQHSALSVPLQRAWLQGFGSANKGAREGDLEVTVQTTEGPRVFTLPWFFVRQVDELLLSWRDAALLSKFDGNLGRTLCWAARRSFVLDSLFLLATEADVNYEHTAHNSTPLTLAANHGCLPLVSAFVEAGARQLGIAVDAAAARGNIHILAWLLDHGAPIDMHFTLHAAVLNDRLESVRMLLDRGAEVDGPWGGAGIFPIQMAREHGFDAVAELLLERGAIDFVAEVRPPGGWPDSGFPRVDSETVIVDVSGAYED